MLMKEKHEENFSLLSVFLRLGCRKTFSSFICRTEILKSFQFFCDTLFLPLFEALFFFSLSRDGNNKTTEEEESRLARLFRKLSLEQFQGQWYAAVCLWMFSTFMASDEMWHDSWAFALRPQTVRRRSENRNISTKNSRDYKFLLFRIWLRDSANLQTATTASSWQCFMSHKPC